MITEEQFKDIKIGDKISVNRPISGGIEGIVYMTWSQAHKDYPKPATVKIFVEWEDGVDADYLAGAELFQYKRTKLIKAEDK